MIPKRIGLLINNPEGNYQQRILNGLTHQCGVYGYDLLVFSSLIEPLTGKYGTDYVMGEFHIFELADTLALDALVVVTVPLHDNQDYSALEWVKRHVRENSRCPVFALDMPVGDYETLYTDDREAFRQIARHMIGEHGAKKVMVLTGPRELELVTMRLKGIRDAMNEAGLSLRDEDIIEGDFWYNGGNALAEKLLKGEAEMPDCVICMNDYMALGLINTLSAGGIRVPEDVKVIAYDGSAEAMLNDISLTSYIPRSALLAQQIINRVRAVIEPGAPISPAVDAEKELFSPGVSCGCEVDGRERYRSAKSHLLYENRDFARADIHNREDLWGFLQSYMYENLTAAADPEDCLHKLSGYLYLLRPYSEFSLMLRQDWEQEQRAFVPGYPARVTRVLWHRWTGDENGEGRVDLSDAEVFDTALILPELHRDHEPQVIYLAPVHFNQDTTGYAALCMRYALQPLITPVFRNWMRAMNNALQIARVQRRLRFYSYHDMSTGLFNRRGMEVQVRRLMREAGPGMQVVAYVIDMDGLKYINDSFGHEEGDRAIHRVSEAVRQVTAKGEVPVRAGGDEFYIIGAGHYTEQEAQLRAEQLEQLITRQNSPDPGYRVGVSVGWCMRMWCEEQTLESILHDADIAMYRAKSAKKYGARKRLT